MKSHPCSRAAAPPAMTVVLSGFASTLSKRTLSTPALRSCSSVRASVPDARVDFPLEIISRAFFPGSFCSPSLFSVPAPNSVRVGTNIS